MTEVEFLKHIHRRIAQTAIGASAIRNQGGKGIIYSLRGYFENKITIQTFIESINDKRKYQSFLTRHTEKVLKDFPPNAQSWGAARKGLNLFFRDIIYNKFLSHYYHVPTNFSKFNQFVQHLEVPLDKEVGLRIRRDSISKAPRWNSIKSLNPELSEEFQMHANIVAQKLKIARVNLDLIYWREAQKVSK